MGSAFPLIGILVREGGALRIAILLLCRGIPALKRQIMTYKKVKIEY
ncbi:MAG: hypothetical protein ACFFCS_14700 [Candidatus Hodarchaeota archaeon]